MRYAVLTLRRAQGRTGGGAQVTSTGAASPPAALVVMAVQVGRYEPRWLHGGP